MHDINFIRKNPDLFDKALIRRGIAACSAEILSLDTKVREFKLQLEELQRQKNQIAKEIAKAKANKEDASELFKKAEQIKEELQKAENPQEAEELKVFITALPNILSDDVPDGESEDDNIEIRKAGNIPEFDFKVKEHTELGKDLGLLDIERAAKVSGTRFAYLKGNLAKLERVLAEFMLNILIEENNFVELSPPLLVKTDTLFSTGQLPKFAEDNFKTTDDRWLIPTSEVPLVAYNKNEILDQDSLPIRYCAYTPCFRSEAGAAGKDTKGIIRMHQFNKVEMVVLCDEESSEKEHESITKIAEEILKRLELPYRVSLLCSKDTGFSANKTYDLEVWLPSQNCYREISSCSNFRDFQGRRLKTRYTNKSDKEKKTVHTLNGSALAVGRTIVAIMENYQNKDGSITIPKVLRPYFNGKEKF